MARVRKCLVNVIIFIATVILLDRLLDRSTTESTPRSTYVWSDPQNSLRVRRLNTGKRRPLSPPGLGTGRVARRRQRSQRQSLFFSMLPGEIRYMMYEYILALRKVHIVGVPFAGTEDNGWTPYRQLGSVTCIGRCKSTCDRTDLSISCWGCKSIRKERGWPRRQPYASNGKIPFLQSCRRV